MQYASDDQRTDCGRSVGVPSEAETSQTLTPWSYQPVKHKQKVPLPPIVSYLIHSHTPTCSKNLLGSLVRQTSNPESTVGYCLKCIYDVMKTLWYFSGTPLSCQAKEAVFLV